MTEDNKNLIPLGNGALPAIIERHTQIANRALGQLSADQTEAFFRKYPEFFRLVVSRYYSLDMELIELILLIEKHQDEWYGGQLSQNEALPWSTDLIKCFEERWDWRQLSQNEALPWSTDLIDRYEDWWDWYSLSQNTQLLRIIEFIESYDYEKYYEEPLSFWWKDLSKNKWLPWSHCFYERLAGNWNIHGVAEIYDGNIRQLNREQVIRLLETLKQPIANEIQKF